MAKSEATHSENEQDEIDSATNNIKKLLIELLNDDDTYTESSFDENATFVELGGDSIKALNLSFKLQELDYTLDVQDILSDLPIRGLATKLCTKHESTTSSPKSLPSSNETSNDLDFETIVLEILEDVETNDLDPNSTFVQLGGDSIKALNLSFRLEELGYTLEVKDILEDVSLEQIRTRLNKKSGSNSEEQVSPEDEASDNIKEFSLVDKDKENILQDASEQTGKSSKDIEDIYPCTSQQKGLFALSLKIPGTYVAYWEYILNEDCNIQRLKDAWKTVHETHQILRTRMVHSVQSSTFQVVVKETLPWKEYNDDHDLAATYNNLDYGESLFQIGVVQRNSNTSFVMWAHHALYDRWSITRIIDDVNRVYHNADTTLKSPPFRNYIQFLENSDFTAGQAFWKEALQNARATTYPNISYQKNRIRVNASMEKVCKIASKEKTFVQCTKSSLLAAAWSLVLQQHTMNDDIIFGLTTWGRSEKVSQVLDIVGPTFNTIPYRFSIDSKTTKDTLLMQTQEKLAQLTCYQHVGIDIIQKIDSDCLRACEFQNILVIQPKLPPSQVDGASILSKSNLTRFALEQTHPLILECSLSPSEITLKAIYDNHVINDFSIENLLNQMILTITKLQSQDDTKLMNLEIFGEQDVKTISEWQQKASIVEKVDDCIHNLFREQAEKTPNATAIYTSKSTMTYEELNHYAASLSKDLVKNYKVDKGDIIPICMDKSEFNVVAMLGILETGAAYVCLDPRNPDERLTAIIQETEAKLVICSSGQEERLEKIWTNNHYVLDREHSSRISSDTSNGSYEQLCGTASSGSDIASITFTSGSTGKPKGVITPHSSMCTSVLSLLRDNKMNEDSRMLQFASLAFDASTFEIYSTLLAGGTLCVPMDDEQLSGLTEFIEGAKANISYLSTTVAANLDPDDVPTLKTLIVGSEPITSAIVQKWPSKVCLKFGYGPTEATIINCRMGPCDEHTDPRNMGQSINAPLWIADVNDYNKLVPIGVEGELIISGPTLAAGYYKNQEATSKAFKDKPDWAKYFPELDIDKVYLTNDIVKYNEDGTITYVERQGGYVKIAGYRIEIGEIDHHLYTQGYLGSKVATILWKTGSEEDYENSGRSILVTFYVAEESANDSAFFSHDNSKFKVWNPSKESEGRARKALEAIKNQVPEYMVPSVFIPASSIAYNANGKLDRPFLISFLNETGREEINNKYMVGNEASSDESTEGTDLSEQERELRDLWVSVLDIQKSKISTRSNFLSIGGNSECALRLVAAARTRGWQLRVSDVFYHSNLKDMAKCLRYKKANNVADRSSSCEPLSMLDESIISAKDAKKIAAEICQVPVEFIVDVYPCSPIQDSIMSAALKSPGTYIQKRIFKIDDQLELEALEAALVDLSQQYPLLRNRIFPRGGEGMFQASIDEKIKCDRKKATPTSFRDEEQQQSIMGIGTPLYQFTILEDRKAGNHLVWTMHHTLYDGISLAFMYKILKQSFQKSASKEQDPIDFRSYMQYLRKQDKQRAEDFWREYLNGVSEPTCLPKRTSDPENTFGACSKTFEVKWKKSNFTSANVVRAAWGLCLAAYCDSKDVSFLMTLSGRDLPLDGIENLPGPTINTLPIRVVVQPEQSIEDYLNSIQHDATKMINHQILGLGDIKYIDDACKQASAAGSLLVVQHDFEEEGTFALEDCGLHELKNFYPTQYPLPLRISCTIQADGVYIDATYNKSLCSNSQIEFLFAHFVTAIRHLNNDDQTVLIKDLTLANENDIKVYKAFNERKKERHDTTIAQEVLKQASLFPKNEAMYSSARSVSYAELDEFSAKIEQFIRKTRSGPSPYVMVCFEKSVWGVVSMLAILRAGCAYVPLDPKDPEDRRRKKIKQTEASLVLVSREQANLFDTKLIKSQVVDEEFVTSLDERVIESTAEYDPQSHAYIIFTSGTTGEPKGVIVDNGPICTLLRDAQDVLEWNDKTRHLQYTPFYFDVSVAEIWGTLTTGGCICLPSEEERYGDIDQFLVESRADLAFMTPSASMLLSPNVTHSLRKLLLGGEAVLDYHLRRWKSSQVQCIECWGPSETCVYATMNLDTKLSDCTNLGTPVGGDIWLTDPDNCNQMVGVGCVGELTVSGNTLGHGYLKNEEKTNSTFVHPSFLEVLDTGTTRAYNTGDLAWMDPDGHLRFVARKDTQVKINGMRVELGDIESNISSSGLMENIDVLLIDQSDQNDHRHPVLVCFFTLSNSEEAPSKDKQSKVLDMTEKIEGIIESATSKLKDALPAHMIPSYFIPLTFRPQTSNNKKDRKALKNIFASWIENQEREASNNQFNEEHEDMSSSSTETDVKLRGLWAKVLRIEAKQLNSNSHFLQMGGDSISAIRLSNLAHEAGLGLTNNDIFKHLVFRDMASVCKPSEEDIESDSEDPEPFSLLPADLSCF